MSTQLLCHVAQYSYYACIYILDRARIILRLCHHSFWKFNAYVIELIPISVFFTYEIQLDGNLWLWLFRKSVFITISYFFCMERKIRLNYYQITQCHLHFYAGWTLYIMWAENKKKWINTCSECVRMTCIPGRLSNILRPHSAHTMKLITMHICSQHKK